MEFFGSFRLSMHFFLDHLEILFSAQIALVTRDASRARTIISGRLSPADAAIFRNNHTTDLAHTLSAFLVGQ